MVSFIGMRTQEVKVAGNVSVVLKAESELIDEVVITGYGVSRKVAFTGSAQTVDNKIITKTTDADPIRSLQGSVAGLQMSNETGQPGGYNSVQIRGLNSFNAGTAPLYVIDGVPMTTGKFGMREDESQTINPLATLNPNDIESISVLKDATATSIYGARATNGVIVINTKSGKSGKTKVSLNIKAGIAVSPSRGNYKMLNTADYMKFLGYFGKNSGWIDDATNMNDVKELITSDEGLGMKFTEGCDTDWYKEVTRTGNSQDYNLDVVGGNERLKFFISGGYFKENGFVIGKDMERYSGRVNLENKINKHVTFGVNLTASYSEVNSGAGGGYFSDPITQALMQLPFQPVRNEDGSWNMDTDNGYNPVAQRSYLGDRSNAKQYKAIVAPFVSINFLNDFTFLSRYGLDYYNAKEFGRWSMLQPQGNDMKMMGEEGNTYRVMWTWTNTLTWLKNFGNHHLNVMLGHELQKSHDESAYLAGSNFPVDFVFTIENASTPSEVRTSIKDCALASYFGKAEYDYNDKYYASASVRRDGSSRFGANNKWATFWSTGVKYRIINEEFMEPVKKVLTNLTLRASYGTTGNQDVDWYQALGLYGFGNNYNSKPGMVPTQIANPNLKWEQTGKLNIGVEFCLFDRLTVDLEYYRNKTTNMLFNVPVSYATGFSSVMKNVGEMENKGIEAVIGYKVINTTNFGWDLGLNISHNKNKILKLSTDKPIETNTTIREVGRPYNSFKMKEFAGVDPETGEQMWYKGEEGIETTKSYNEAGKRYVGSADPKVYGGLNTNVRVYNFDLSAQFNYSFGGKVYNNAARYDENTNNAWGNTTQYVFDNMWKKPGDITNVPAPISGAISSHSTRYLMDGSYIKLKNIQLGYTLPNKMSSKLGLSNLRVYVSGENLCTWALGDDFRGIDPEVGADGIMWWNYPIAKKVMFGLNVSF